MNTKYTAIFLRESNSSWVSCQSITKNLLDSYQQVYHNLKIIYLPDYLNDINARKIKLNEFERLIFIDHNPNPSPLIKRLDNTDVEVVVHLFGDFMLQLNSWTDLDDKRIKLKFIAASSKQADIVKLLTKGNDKIDVIPFPLENEYFLTDFKKKEGQPLTFIYAGRLNEQKNISDLIEGFLKYKKTFNSNAVLKIVGFQDHLGTPFLGKRVLPGVFAHQFFQFKKQLDNPNDLLYLGALTRDELKAELLDSDIFVSMSTYNDEDFGMIVSEALACGLTCLLSDWAGYSNFKTYCPNKVELVKINDESLKPDLNQLSKKMFSMENKELSKENNSIEYLSVKKIAEKLKQIDEVQYFSGWNERFEKVRAQFEFMPDRPFCDGKGNYSKLYREVYHPYWKQYE